MASIPNQIDHADPCWGILGTHSSDDVVGGPSRLVIHQEHPPPWLVDANALCQTYEDFLQQLSMCLCNACTNGLAGRAVPVWLGA